MIEKQEYKLTKEHSAAVHGLAILLMLFHHLFSSAYSYTGVDFINIDLAVKAAWFGKICVGLYAFTGGYGVYHVFMRKQSETIKEAFINSYRAVFLQIIRLYLKLWFVMAVFLIVDIIFIHSPLDFSFMTILGNMTAINPTYSGIWWYARQYAIMLVMLPVLHIWLAAFKLITDKVKKTVFYIVSTCILLVTAGVMLVFFREAIRYIQPSFVMIFFAGYLFARYDLYRRFDKAVNKRADISWIFAILFLLASIVARVILADSAAWAELDFVIVPVFVYGFTGLISLSKPVEKCFTFMGRFSTFMWLCHGFVYAYFLNLLCDNLKNAAAVYVAMTLITLGIAAVFELVPLKKLFSGLKKKAAKK